MAPMEVVGPTMPPMQEEVPTVPPYAEEVPTTNNEIGQDEPSALPGMGGEGAPLPPMAMVEPDPVPLPASLARGPPEPVPDTEAQDQEQSSMQSSVPREDYQFSEASSSTDPDAPPRTVQPVVRWTCETCDEVNLNFRTHCNMWKTTPDTTGIGGAWKYGRSRGESCWSNEACAEDCSYGSVLPGLGGRRADGGRDRRGAPRNGWLSGHSRP